MAVVQEEENGVEVHAEGTKEHLDSLEVREY